MTTIQKIVPHLWYNKEAVEAAKFYVSIFPDSKVTSVTTISDTPSGSVDIVTFKLSGQSFMAISAGPHFKFNESVSFMIYCQDQKEIDHYWNKLTTGGEEQPCGWLKDKFGLSWQVVPTRMDEMMEKGTKEQVGRVTAAFLEGSC
jgi:predicted 3-demethylubiquinone-9 3-methyltransferase (glyoxalase superfamily)